MDNQSETNDALKWFCLGAGFMAFVLVALRKVEITEALAVFLMAQGACTVLLAWRLRRSTQPGVQSWPSDHTLLGTAHIAFGSVWLWNELIPSWVGWGAGLFFLASISWIALKTKRLSPT